MELGKGEGAAGNFGGEGVQKYLKRRLFKGWAVGWFGRLVGKGQWKKEVKKIDSQYKKSRLGKGIDVGLLVRARVHKYSEKLILSAWLREVRRAKIAGGQDGEQLKKEIKKTDSRYKKRWSDRGSTGWI